MWQEQTCERCGDQYVGPVEADGSLCAPCADDLAEGDDADD